MDPTIGRLQAALASVTNEVTVAAANLNFDFSIVKYEAPKEFHPIGQILSPKRKYDAEDGSCHIIARRLAALFAGVCPKCPELIKAYGKRASEIAEKATNEASQEHFDSIFSQYTGVDATSMWAAATSSDDADGRAIHVHLLACLLASTWKAPEAISIWVQIIAERRREIAQRIERGEPVDFATASAAAQQEIPRSQLAEWDASARSWLETADGIKKWEQKQLALILDNFEASVASQKTVYDNVVKVWKTASTTMDNLVSGIAQEVQAGTMLGLKAWHLYPDMHVFGKQTVQVEMKDPLIKVGGVLSLMCSPSATTPKSGITWSLSLASLKFYGDPVETTAHMQGESSRLTIKEFRVVLLGCILRIWNIAPKQESITIKLLAALSLTFLDQWRDSGFRNAGSANTWHCDYADAFTLLEKAQAHYRDDELNSAVLVNLGRNRPEFKPRAYTVKGSSFGSRPFFGLLDSGTFLRCLRSPDDKVSALRRCASRVEKLHNCHAIIQYKTADNEDRYTTLNDGTGSALTLCSTSNPERLTRRRDLDSTMLAESTTQIVDVDVDGWDVKGRSSHDAINEDGREKAGTDKSRSNDDSGYEDNLLHAAFGSTSLSPEDDKDDKDDEYDEYDEDDEDDEDGEDGEDDEYDEDVQENKSGQDDPTTLLLDFNGQKYQFYFGSSHTASIFVPVGYYHTSSPSFEPEDILWALEHRMLTWDGYGFIATDSIIPWLSHFEYALRCLQGLPGPIISVHTLRNTSPDPKWVGDLKSTFSNTVARPSRSWNPTASEILSILVYFLAGCDISSSELHESTTGISYGNSIYVPTELLRDPLEMKGKHRSITRILGNVGLPGLIIFSSVDSPMVAPVDDAYYRVIDMNQFDGRPENHFGSTTMHLSFTKWERSLDMVNSQGKQDVQFTRKESVISIRESGHWIGDFDVMAALRSPYIYTSPPQEPCNCKHNEGSGGKPSLDPSLRSIETWNQLRECQSGLSVVRVHGNWLARLAVTAYLAQRADQNGGDGARITLLPAKVCWTCFEHKFSSNIYIY